MTEADANKALLQTAYRKWHESRGGTMEELLEMCDDDIRFDSLAQGAAPLQFTSPRSGRAQLRGYFDGLLSGWSMNHFTVHSMIAEGDRVAVIATTSWTNKSTGKSVETPKIDVWRLKNSRAIEFYEYYDTALVMAAAT